MKEMIQVSAKISASVFERFAYFDTYKLKKRYRSPLLFALIMSSFAVVCFLLRDKEQSALLGTVLLSIGLLMPISYFAMFTYSVKTQIKTMKLNEGPRDFYTLTLTDAQKGIGITSADGKEKVQVEWAKTFGAYRVDGCIYLYITPAKAFLLPADQANVSDDELFAALMKKLGENRVKDLRKKKN